MIAGRFAEPVSVGAGNVKVYLTISHQASANQLAQTANKEFDFFTDSFGEPESERLNVVELPDDTLPAVYAPELAAIMGSRVGDKSGIRLLANTIAHQWWGCEVSPQDAQRCLDHQRHVALRRADVCGGGERQERPASRS